MMSTRFDVSIASSECRSAVFRAAHFKACCSDCQCSLPWKRRICLFPKVSVFLWRNAKLSQPPTDDERARVDKCAEDVYQEQAEAVMAQRKAEIEQQADNIVAGLVKKRRGQQVSKKARKKLKKNSSTELSKGNASSCTELSEVQPEDMEAQREAVIANVMKSKVSMPSRDITLAPVLYECLRTKASNLVPVELNYPRT
ncbi:hypothetical protein MRX96_052375 [Rhipicephalus microplus]